MNNKILINTCNTHSYVLITNNKITTKSTTATKRMEKMSKQQQKHQTTINSLKKKNKEINRQIEYIEGKN